MSGIEIGKISDSDFLDKTHDQQHITMFRGIEEAQKQQAENHAELITRLSSLDDLYLKKPKIRDIRTIFGFGVFVVGVIWGIASLL